MEVPSKVYYQHYEVLQKIQKLRTSGYSRWILANPEELQKIEKMLSVFVVDKRSCKVCRSTKDTIIKSLTSLEITPQSDKKKGILHVVRTVTHAC